MEIWLGIVTLLLTVLIPGAVTGLWKIFSLQRDVRDAERRHNEMAEQIKADKAAFAGRLEKAEESAQAVNGLAQAIEHLSQNLKTELAHLGARTDDHLMFIKQEIGHLRANKQMAARFAAAKVTSKG